MSRKTHKIGGTFNIIEMELWDTDFLNLITQAYMQINPDGTGRFQFGAVDAFMDCHSSERDGKPVLEFSWEGFDECDPVSGRGSAVLEDGTLTGCLYFHMGDDSCFVARRVNRNRKSNTRNDPQTYTWTAKAEDILKKVRRARAILDKMATA